MKMAIHNYVLHHYRGEIVIVMSVMSVSLLVYL